jgi:transcription-repair coupling factor (superfamily II helicase)
LLRAALAELSAGRPALVAGSDPVLAQLLALGLAAQPGLRRLVIVVRDGKDIGAWSEYLGFVAQGLEKVVPRRAAVLPHFSSYGNDRYINPAPIRRQRLHALSLLAEPGQASLVVTTAMALAQTTLSPEALRTHSLALAVGAALDQDKVVARLEEVGFAARASVDEEGTYAVRGGIVDVFPPNLEQPVRLEFAFDELASIRHFAVGDQRSTGTLERVGIAPAYEAVTPERLRKEQAQRLYEVLLEQDVVPADRDGLAAQFRRGLRFPGFDMFAPLFRPGAEGGEEGGSGTGFDYLAPGRGDAALIFPAGSGTCSERFAEAYEAMTVHFRRDSERALPTMPPATHFLAPAAVDAALRAAAGGARLELGDPFATAAAGGAGSWEEREGVLRLAARLSVLGAPGKDVAGSQLFEKWMQIVEETRRDEGATVAVLTHHDEQQERVVNLLTHRGLSPEVCPTLMADLATGALPRGRVLVGQGDLVGPARLRGDGGEHILVVPEQMLFGARPRRARASQKLQNYLSSFADLKADDLVVHVQHGIARYRGMTSLTVAGVTGDFLILEFAGGDKIYLPVDRLSLLQRYSAGGEGGGAQALDRLGGQGWDKRKSRVRGAVKDMAEALLAAHARRAVARGHAYGPPDDTYLRFESAFPYEETDDQLRAIQDVEADLRSGKPMDRLVCGDVGFGKTEVALRATMRTVLEGFQVLVLVPTTVLCHQHFRTFKARLEPHGVRVAQVNRFVSAQDTRTATEGLASGAIDVVIGTHRLFAKDVKPSRLGLLVVDEEQRFGVTHKEALKELRAGGHVLTLTATPIPRTLHMAMVGLRDISVITTPPQGRLSVKTYVARFDEELIRTAIEQELRRGGQCFYVHNRVEDIEQLRSFIANLVPGVDVRVGHGQMREHQLEKVIVDFLDQKFPVLLCTTIIESGIDMPNVNTMIVDRADRMGLAQLYQLRGRVGRGQMQAYAYLLAPADERLTDEARQRLDVLAAHQELGAGFQIASHDLELRGAGNLLGAEQSGHAAAIGLDLYTEMLEQAIQGLQGKPVEERIDTEIKIPVSAVIPSTYVPSETQRVQLYKSLFACEGDGDLRALRQEMQDRFGPLPEPATLLFKVARLKQQLRRLGATRLTVGKTGAELRFAALTEGRIDALIKAVARQPTLYRLTPDYRLLLPMTVADQPSTAEQDQVLAALQARLDPLLEA